MATVLLTAESRRLTNFCKNRFGEGYQGLTGAAESASVADARGSLAEVLGMPLSWVAHVQGLETFLAARRVVVALPDPTLRLLSSVSDKVLDELDANGDRMKALEFALRDPLSRSDYASRLRVLDMWGIDYETIVFSGLRPRQKLVPLVRKPRGNKSHHDLSRPDESQDWATAIHTHFPRFVDGVEADILQRLRLSLTRYQQTMQERVNAPLPWIAVAS